MKSFLELISGIFIVMTFLIMLYLVYQLLFLDLARMEYAKTAYALSLSLFVSWLLAKGAKRCEKTAKN